jgi:hypothetical protein
MTKEDVEKELDRIRQTFEPVIDITPTEVEESDAESGPEESGSGVVEADLGRPEDERAEN